MRIVLVAAEPTFRLGFRALIEQADDLQVVDDASDARAGLRAVDTHRPDIVVMEIALPGMNGVDATRELSRRMPELRILLLGGWLCERDVFDGFAAGAHGFALKSDSTDSLRQTVRVVGEGGTVLSHEMRGMPPGLALDWLRSRKRVSPDLLEPLSLRERAVLDLVLKGWRNREIAHELCISIKTVDTHRTHINRKLHCTCAADLVRFAAENGLLHHTPPAAPPLEAAELPGNGTGSPAYLQERP